MNYGIPMHWYDDHRWIQHLRGCYEVSPRRNHPVYSFPIEEILYQLLLKAIEPLGRHCALFWNPVINCLPLNGYG